jgi:hypothetical protein
MGIAPVDLQTLFTQLEKVGKTQAAQREGHVIQQAMQNVQLQRKIDEQLQQVNEAQNTGEGVEKVKDRDSEQENKQNSSGRDNSEKSDGEEDGSPSVVRDPTLGRNIDISL